MFLLMHLQMSSVCGKTKHLPIAAAMPSPATGRSAVSTHATTQTASQYKALLAI